MRIALGIVLALLFTTRFAQAQDISPALDPVQAGHAAVLDSANRSAAARSAEAYRRAHHPAPPTQTPVTAPTRKPTNAQYCASLPYYRKRYGSADMRVQNLTSACKAAGYTR